MLNKLKGDYGTYFSKTSNGDKAINIISVLTEIKIRKKLSLDHKPKWLT